MNMPAGVHPNSLANLRTIPAEQRNIGRKKGSGVKAKIRLYMRGVTEGDFNGEKVTLTEEEWIIIEAVRDAKKGNYRARNFLFDRLYGKPVETHRTTGTITHEHVIGKSWDELSAEELDLIIQSPEQFKELPDGRIVDAEFESDQTESGVTEASN